MRAILTVLSAGLVAVAVFLSLHSDNRQTAARETTSIASPVKHDFEKDIKPIFQARCQPCHFEGGKVYDKLPFDKPATITKLGTKLFTRIKDEKERKLIQEFLADH